MKLVQEWFGTFLPLLFLSWVGWIVGLKLENLCAPLDWLQIVRLGFASPTSCSRIGIWAYRRIGIWARRRIGGFGRAVGLGGLGVT